MEIELGKQNHFFENFSRDISAKFLIKEKRIKILKIVVLLLIFILFFRLGWLQIIEGSLWKYTAEINRVRVERIKAPRGLIWTRDKMLLAKNVPTFALSVVPADLSKDTKKRKQLLEKLCQEIGNNAKIDYQAIETAEKAPSYSYQKIVLIPSLDYKQFVSLRVKLKNWPGIVIEPALQRQYPQGEPFSHILGYLGKISPQEIARYPYYSINDFFPKAGVEKVYEPILRGKDGRKKVEVNSYGRQQKLLAIENPLSGKDVVLTINGALQEKIAKLLEKHLKKLNLSYGTVIALNPNNGEVLAVVSFPAYDNNIFISGSNQKRLKVLNQKDNPLVFRAISGLYPSGSTIKGALAAGALEEGIINENTKINSTGGIKVGHWFFPDWKRGGHGRVDVVDALANSVNTFFYYIGGGYGDFQGMGWQGINHYLELFGFGKKTGIDLPNEADGLLPTPLWKEKVKGEPWYLGDTYHLSIGQGDILATPLQIATYTMAIANGGTLYRPHLLFATIDTESKEKEYVDKEIIRDNFISKEYIKVVQKGFRAAVTRGSARYLRHFKPEVAGKTGTAEVKGKKPHAWFTCFAPYSNPEIVLTILIENGGEGFRVAVPLAKEILDWYWKHQEEETG